MTNMYEALPEPLRRLTRRRLLLLVGALVLASLILFGLINRPPAGAATGLAAQSFFVLALLAFTGGVISFVSPCTLPILPAYFAFASQSGRSKIALNTVFFMLGVATMFSLLGASASALGSLLVQNQQVLLLLGGAIVMGFGVMSLLGRGFTGVSTSSAGEQPAGGPGGSYVFGLTFSVGWSSCVGPILGVVLTLAASTGSVPSGFLLLFIYALGLGLPLIVVSTFFGRADRQSFFWRLLRGKGWFKEVHTLIAALPWALAAWFVLSSFVDYIYATIPFFSGHEFSPLQWGLLLLLALAGGAVWTISQPEPRKTLVELHTTQLFSGVLFIFLAVLMLNGTLAQFNELIPADLTIWFAGVEEFLIDLFA